MGILQRQIRKKTEEVTRNLLLQGMVPEASQVARELGKFLKTADGGPTMRPRRQAARAIWDFRTTNNVLKDIRFDLETAFEEVWDQFGTLINRASLIDLTYQAQRYELDSLLSLLKNLSFTTKNLEDNFYGVFDTFDDLSKIDKAKTKRDAVDLNEGVVLLPQTDITGDKVNMGHLFARQAWPVTVDAAPDPGGQSVVVQNEAVPGAIFGNAFSDMVNAWRQVVTTGNGLGCTIEFTIPLVEQTNSSVSISRIFLLSAATQEQDVSITHSFDGVNYTRLPNVDETVTVPPGRGTSLDFETVRARFIRFRCSMSNPTAQDGVSFSYVFGFRNISFYKLGRVQDAELVSLPLEATAMEKAIDKVSLSTMESIPANCNISWFIAAADAAGNPRDDVWRPINPISRAPLEGIPQIVKFSESATKRIHLPAPDPETVYETVRGVDFYKITSSVLDEIPLFRQAFLYRGENAWWRNTQRELQTRQSKDVFIDFNSGDVQRLYVVSTEISDVSVEVGPRNVRQTVLSVASPIDYEPATMLIVPPDNVDPEVDQRPRYAIYSVLRFRDKMTVSNEQVALNGTSWSSLANSGLMATGNGRPVVKNVGESVTYTEGMDYTLEEDPSTHKLTGRIRRISTGSVVSNIGDGDTVKVTYELDPDITYLVSSTQGSKVYLSKDLGNVQDQSFQVTYRLTPKPPYNEIKKPTVHVTSQYGSDEGDTYEEGRDYLVDTDRGTITRIPAGNIRGELVAFVDFRYEQTPKDLDTFTTWIYVERRDPFVIEINPLGIDVEAGEYVLVDGTDISTKTVFPELAFGYHQVVVKSKRPEAFSGAAIVRVASLVDRNGDAVFVAGGKFFTRMAASRIPLTQKSYTQLTKSTGRNDHAYFAISDEGHVIVNFLPGSTEEVYLYGLRFVNGTLTAGTWPEQFRLEYAYALDTADPVRKILVRALLSRGADTDGGITPKIFEYHARLA